MNSANELLKVLGELKRDLEQVEIDCEKLQTQNKIMRDALGRCMSKCHNEYCCAQEVASEALGKAEELMGD